MPADPAEGASDGPATVRAVFATRLGFGAWVTPAAERLSSFCTRHLAALILGSCSPGLFRGIISSTKVPLCAPPVIMQTASYLVSREKSAEVGVPALAGIRAKEPPKGGTPTGDF